MKAALACLALCGCTLAPHGSKASHQIWTYQGRQDGLVRYEVIRDRSAGGGAVLLMDPKASTAVLVHTNSMLQTGGSLSIGEGSINVDPQTGAIIGAVGSAAGNIIGAAMKSAAGVP